MTRLAETLHVGVIDEQTDTPVFPDGSEQRVSSPISPSLEKEIDDFIVDLNAPVTDEEALVDIDAPALTAEDTVKKLVRSNTRDNELRHRTRAREDYDDVPAEFRPKLWGESIIKPVRLGDIILLEQTRQSKNPEYGRLTESIRNEGLHKEPELDVLDGDHFKELLKVLYFRVYKGEMPADIVDQFQPSADGLYYTATNGNTRTLILVDEAKETAAKAKKAGYNVNPYDTQVMCKLQFNRSPEEILGSQISDNFQSAPPVEDVAFATISHYQYLRSTGAIHSRAEYVDKVGGKLTSDILDGMIAYIKLPEPIHALVQDKALTRSVAIDIAKLRELKLKELGLKLYGNDYQMFVNTFDEDANGNDALLELINGDEAREMRDTIDLWLTKIAADVYHRKLRDKNYGPTKQRTTLKGMKLEIERTIASLLHVDDEAELPGSEVATAEGEVAAEQIRLRHSNHKIFRNSLQRELSMLSLEIANNPISKIEKVAATLRALGESSVTDTLANAKNRKAVRTVLGATGLDAETLDAIDVMVARRTVAAAHPEMDSLF